MVNEFLRFEWKKALLTVFLLICTGLLASLVFMTGVPIKYGLEAIRVLGLPFNLLPLLEVIATSFIMAIAGLIIMFALTVVWQYLLACSLVFLARILFTGGWTKWKLAILGAALIILLVYAGYSIVRASDVFAPRADDSGATPEGVAELVRANNQFAVKMYSEISKKTEGNIFFSPWSITDAVAMAYEGARGQTAEEIESVFGFPSDDLTRKSSFASMMNTINLGGGQYELSNANAIWLQKGYPFLEGYKSTIEDYYMGKTESVDFLNSPDAAVSRINSWVSENTNGKIKTIISRNNVGPDTSAVLTNAIYFKGKWVNPFNRQNTKPMDFTLENGANVNAQMMYLKETRLNYAEADGMQILELPYKGDKISMLIILPIIRGIDLLEEMRMLEEGEVVKRGNMSSLELMLSEDKISEWKAQLEPTSIVVEIPKYKFETSYTLTDYLKQMGIKSAFDRTGMADFSGMDGSRQLYISDVLHKAYIDVYEEGTEAAAATSISFGALSAIRRKMFIADHPFIFILQEKESGNILFIGRVSDPTK